MTRVETLVREVERHIGADAVEAAHRDAILALLRDVAEPFSRSTFPPGHITASIFVVDVVSRTMLLHHHRRLDRSA